jgi:exodeoxyribonuclease-3
MKFVSWNVNGLRAVLKKGFEDTVRLLDPDIMAIQETKLQAGQATVDLPVYHEYWSYAQRKGYSGTAVFSKREPLHVLHGFSQDEPDDEGRICALEFDDLWFVCIYSPNAQRELARIDFRMDFEDRLRDFLTGLASDKPVVVCGDLNVAHQEIDLKNPGPNRGNAGFSDEERGKFQQLLDAGFIDTFRYFYPNRTGAYSWWSYRFNARATNAGWRIDYFLVSRDLESRLERADIFSEVMGSDHCPVMLELADSTGEST